MQDLDINVIFIGIFLLAFVLLGIIFTIVYLFSANRQITRARVGKLKQRFGGARVKQGDSKSVFTNTTEVTTLDSIFQSLPSLSEVRLRLAKTGRKLTLAHYAGMIFISGGIGFVAFNLLLNTPPILAFFVALIIGFGLPHLVVSAMIKTRLKNFLALFPDALDLIVRGLRSGLPITESMGSVASEIDDPVGGEFRKIMDQIRVGRTLDEALESVAQRIDIPEYKFFMISLAIQRETGGNLAETLSKLSDLLRRRQQMKLKIKAMASEGKASAYIISALPFVMFGMIMLINYDYASVLITDTRAIYSVVGGIVWMSIGGFIMKQMISFEI